MTESRVNLTVVTVGKYLLLAAMAAYLVLRLFGGQVSKAPFAQVEEAVLSAAVLDPMTEGDNQLLRRVYGLEPEEYDGVCLYFPAGNMNVEELLLVKLRDLSQQAEVKKIMEDRVAYQISVFEGYAPEQVAMLKRSVIEVRGNYLLLVVAELPEPVRQAFLKAL